MEHAFTLRVTLADPSADPARWIEPLGRSGCTDAVVGLGSPGCIALAFAREAATPGAAMASAMDAVFRAIPDARGVETVYLRKAPPGEV